jgi:hypothetical protein
LSRYQGADGREEILTESIKRIADALAQLQVTQ